LTTSVKPMPKFSSAASCSGLRTSTESPLRTRALSLDAVNPGQKRFVERAK
jgi:hypothetical protein